MLVARCFLAGLIGWTIAGTVEASTLPAVAPAAQDAKAELDKKLAAIDQNDANAVFEVAKWADENNLKTDSKRLLRQVIKINPDHAEARALLGYEKYEGKWLTKREIEREKAKAEEAEKAKLGLKKWKGEWVPAEDYANLEKGLVKATVNGQPKWVTPVEKERIDKGMELHDGIWVTAEDLEHQKKGEFKVGDKWLTQAEADKVHADFTNPWELEGDFCQLTTTCSLAFGKEALRHADASVRQTYKIVGIDMPKDLPKVGLIMVKEVADYTQLGQNVQDNNDATMSSAWSTFVLSDQNTGRFIGVSVYEVLQEGNQKGNDDFSLGHVRFAAASAALRNMQFAETPPTWFNVGVACYCERFWHPFHSDGVKKLGAWSLDSLNKEGGMLQLKSMFDTFTITKQSVLQAGLIISYLQNGTLGPKVQEQWKKCQEAFKAPKQKGLEKDFVKLELQLSKDGEKEIDAYATSIRG
jgi:hypothetical protein